MLIIFIMIYSCKFCDYETTVKRDMNKHNETDKHKKTIINTPYSKLMALNVKCVNDTLVIDKTKQLEEAQNEVTRLKGICEQLSFEKNEHKKLTDKQIQELREEIKRLYTEKVIMLTKLYEEKVVEVNELKQGNNYIKETAYNYARKNFKTTGPPSIATTG